MFEISDIAAERLSAALEALPPVIDWLSAAAAIVAAAAAVWIPWKIHSNQRRQRDLEDRRLAASYRRLAINEIEVVKEMTSTLVEFLSAEIKSVQNAHDELGLKSIFFDLSDSTIDVLNSLKAQSQSLAKSAETWPMHLDTDEASAVATLIRRARILELRASHWNVYDDPVAYEQSCDLLELASNADSAAVEALHIIESKC